MLLICIYFENNNIKMIGIEMNEPKIDTQQNSEKQLLYHIEQR